MTSAHLALADGPLDPPSSRPRSGVLGGDVFTYRFEAGEGMQRIVIPGLEGVEVHEDTIVHWAFYADGDDAALAPHAALAVTIDVVAEAAADSDAETPARLSADARVRDRYGFALDASAQFAARWSMPEQWNADSIALGHLAGRTVAIEAVLGVNDDDVRSAGEVGGFIEVVVERVAPAVTAPSPAERVDTRRGSHAGDRFSRGNTIPAVAVPHGFCFVTPATDATDARWPYRPFLHDDPQGRRLEAVQFSHQPSPWIGDRGVLQLMPFTGEPVSSREGRRRWIESGTERARPHEYAAELSGGLALEVTATSHGAAFRVAGDSEARVGFVIDQLDAGGGLDLAADGREFTGWVPAGTADWGNPPRTYFAGRVVGDTAGSGMLDDDGRSAVAGYVEGRGALEVRVALSFLSAEQARVALDAELGAQFTFAQLREALQTRWDDVLDAVTIPPLETAQHPFLGLADAENRARIASALYRLHLYPNTHAEDVPDGDGGTVRRYADPMEPNAPDAQVRDGDLMVNNGYWDTYRTAWPALALLDPAATGRMLDGLLAQWHGGGWMARWSAPGYVDSMVGTSSDQIFADGLRWGADFDRAGAFESAWRNAAEPSADPRRGRKGIGRGRFTGHISSAVPEGMSWSIENAISDGAIARFADDLAAESDGDEAASRYRAYARHFANRSRSYRQLFDPEHGFFRGRGDDGTVAAAPFDPRVWGGDNVETNAWGMSVSAVHDGPGLADLYGGPAGLRAHLDRLFAEPETADAAFGGSYGTVIHEQREARALRSGMCAISNQPAHHIPWMHVHGDQPWRAGAEVHDLAGRLFSGAMIAQGFPGDEDNGEMSAWWLWAALGLYPLELGSGELRIGAPLLDDVTVRRAGGGTLRVLARRQVPQAQFLVSARLDGEALTAPVLPLAALTGATHRVLELEFSASAADAARSPLWQRQAEPVAAWHPDLTGPAAGVAAGVAVGVADAAALFDDRGETRVVLAAGQRAGLTFPEPVTVSDVTVTAADAAPAGAVV